MLTRQMSLVLCAKFGHGDVNFKMEVVCFQFGLVCGNYIIVSGNVLMLPRELFDSVPIEPDTKFKLARICCNTWERSSSSNEGN
jgi:hypothetical protein